MAFKNGLMVLSTKVSGLATKLREKVPSGMPKVTFILASSKLTKLMDLVSTLMSMDQGTKASG